MVWCHGESFLLLLLTILTNHKSLLQESKCTFTNTTDTIIDIKTGLAKGLKSLMPFRTDTVEECHNKCCTDLLIIGGNLCNFMTFDPRKKFSFPNCYLFYCPNKDACPLMDSKGYVSHFIQRDLASMKGLDESTKETHSHRGEESSDDGVPTDLLKNDAPTPIITIQPMTTTILPLIIIHSTRTSQSMALTALQMTTVQSMTSSTHSTTLSTIPVTTRQLPMTTTLPVTNRKLTAATTLLTTLSSTTTKSMTTTILPTTQAMTTTTLPVTTTQPTITTTLPPTTTQPTTTTTLPPTTTLPLTPNRPTIHLTTTTTVSTTELISKITQQSTVSRIPVAKTPFIGITIVVSNNGSINKKDNGELDQKPHSGVQNQPAGKMEDSPMEVQSGLIAALLFGLVFFVIVVIVISKQITESYHRRHYTRIDYLMNGMYIDA